MKLFSGWHIRRSQGDQMTFAPVQEAAEETTPDVAELLFKEARREARRRRLRFVIAVLMIISAAVVIWRGSGGSHRSAPPIRVDSSNPAPGTPSGSANSAAAVVLEGQSVMSFTPFGSSTLWVVTQSVDAPSGGGQGIELTTSAGRFWKNVTPKGLNVGGGRHFMGGFFALSSKRAWVAYGGSNGPSTLETTGNAGRTWSKVGLLPKTGCTYQFVTVEDGTCSALEGAGGSMTIIIYRTDNGGATWRSIFNNTALAMSPMTMVKGSIPFACDKTVDFTSATTGFALFLCNGGSGAIIYETLDGGKTWVGRDVSQPSSVPEGGGGFWGPPVFDRLNGAVSYSVGHDSLVYVTHDGGRSFLPVYPPGKARQWKVDIVSASIWRLTRGEDILATDNAGRSWFTVMSNLVLENNDYRKGEAPGGNVEFVTRSVGWLLEDPWGSNPSILRTVDGGRQWEQLVVPGTRKLRRQV
jgi:photosystem II stability/assembly factor-like uncharacterized protein